MDPLVPNQVRYQTALHSEIMDAGDRFELPMLRAYETGVVTNPTRVNYLYLVRNRRFELLTSTMSM